MLVMSRSRSNSAETSRQPSLLASSKAAPRPRARPSVALIKFKAIRVVTYIIEKHASTLSCCATRTSLTRVEIAMPIQIDHAAINGVKIT